MLINSNGVAVPNEISLGYLYRDIVEIPEVNEATMNQLPGQIAPELTVEFNLRDFKYLSNAN
jgi:hypothetical protein